MSDYNNDTNCLDKIIKDARIKYGKKKVLVENTNIPKVKWYFINSELDIKGKE